MKKRFAFFLALVLVLGCFAGCRRVDDTAGTAAPAAPAAPAADAESDLAYIQEKGVLVVGITDYEPMDYKDENGEWTGFDAELSRLFAEELGVECEFYVIANWGQKFLELETKQIDAIWNGMTITDEVKLNSSCSDPYVVNAQVVVMRAENVGKYPDSESMKDLTFAVEEGSAGQTAAMDIGAENIVLKQDQGAALLEVKARGADACVIDITMANAMTGEGTDYADLAYEVSLTSEEYGVAFRKDSDLTAELNAFLDKLAADGTLQALAEKYSLTLAE